MNPSAILRPSRDIRYRIIDGEAVVVQQHDARVMNLNETGACILEAMDGTRTVADIVDVLSESFDVEPETLQADVLRFMDELVATNVIEPVS